MNVFISWSKTPSHDIAIHLKNLLPDIFDQNKFFVSSEDIKKGKRWLEQLSKELETTNFGIICVTKNNMENPWLNFEAGALSKSPASQVCTVLFGLTSTEVKGPLEQFQATHYDKEDFKRLVDDMNKEYEYRLDEKVLDKRFENFWKEFVGKIDPIVQKIKKQIIFVFEETETNINEEINQLKTEITNLTHETYQIDNLPNLTESYNLVIYVYSQSNQSKEKLEKIVSFVKSLPQEIPLIIYTLFSSRLSPEEFQIASQCKPILANMPGTLIKGCKESLS